MPAETIIRFGLIGVGRWGQIYVRTLLSLADRCQITHLCTSKPENASLLPHPVSIVSDWRRVIHADCDAIIIATPPHTHAEILEACLDTNKPCIVEKPLCLDVPTAKRLHQRVCASRTAILVNHIHLFDPRYLALKRALNQAGEPIRLILSEGMSLGPFRTDTPALWDWAPHDLSLCLDLLGQLPKQIEALAGPRDPDGSPEAVSLRLDFPNEACAWIHVGRLGLQRRRTLSILTEHYGYLWDQQAVEPLTVASLSWSGRYKDGIPEPLGSTPISALSPQQPMESMISYFLNGLRGGDRRYFGTQLAFDVIRLLAECDKVIQRRSGRVTRLHLRASR